MKNLLISLLALLFIIPFTVDARDFSCSQDDDIAGPFTSKRHIYASTYWPKVGQVVTFSLSNSVPSGGTRDWTFFGPDGSAIISPFNQNSPLITVVGGSLTGDFVSVVFNCRISDVCVSFSWDKGFGRWFTAWRTVYINSNQSGVPITGPSSISCGMNQSLTYSVNHTGVFQTMNWSFPSGWTTSNGTNTISTTSTSVSVNTNGSSGGYVSANFVTPFECQETIGMPSLLVNSSPSQLYMHGPTTICPGLDGFSTYSVTNTPGYTYSWSVTGVLSLAGTSSSGSSATVWAPGVTSGSGTVNCMVTSSCGNASLSKSVSVSWTPCNGGGGFFRQGEQQKNELEESVENNKDNLDESFDSNIMIYPNPVSDIINIAYTEKTNASVRIELWGVSGRKLKTITDYTAKYEGENLLRYNMNDLPSGMYFVRITMDEESVTKAIIHQ